MAIKVTEEDCDNSVSAVLSDGRGVVCRIGYVSGGGFPRQVLFHIEGASCRTEEVYGNTENPSGS
ncbi:MAG: hypothetical protein J7500_02345 [Sphingomonas sp.]|uniref:hypothetical protein n=1 Tax=Sphingomonas sp. TaxID=28214 RepID=UPI001B2C28C1|nr:hypothetical protein [Sphingomonas sp.]MBO9621531.1 hypothetical protein [Sphingomonas sp.]